MLIPEKVCYWFDPLLMLEKVFDYSSTMLIIFLAGYVNFDNFLLSFRPFEDDFTLMFEPPWAELLLKVLLATNC